MKRIIFLIPLILFLAQCKKDNQSVPDDPDANNPNSHGVVIKGHIDSKESKGLENATKVMVFNGLKEWGGCGGTELVISFVDIVNGLFVDSTQRGSAKAYVFLDANNNYIGTLCAHNLNLFPLTSLKNGDTTTINLSTLTLSGTSVIPAHDPFGDEIILSADEINSYMEIQSYFQSLAKNIDADNDGILDVLDNKMIYVKNQFCVTGGKIGFNSTAPVIDDSALSNIGYNTYIYGALGFDCPDTASLSGPAGDPYPQIYLGHLQDGDNQGHGFGTGFGVGNEPFRPGIYTLMLDAKPYTLSFSSLDVKNNIVFAGPTLITDGEGKLVEIQMSYRHFDQLAVNPENIFSSLMLQFNDSVCHQFFVTPWLKSSTSQHQGNDAVGLYSYIPSSPVDISTLKFIDVVYNDLLGNLYFVKWWK